MATLLRLQPRLRAQSSIAYLSRSSLNFPSQRTYAKDTPTTDRAKGASEETGKPVQDTSINHPIPSNKAHPTLRDGNQSPITDAEGNLRDDLPQDVKQHNEEMEDRYDRPFNHISDDGNVEQSWKQ